MKALKLKLFQETVCYRKPFAIKIAETYPLPPYSTVNGLLHKLLDAEEYIPMGISIQGDYETVINNYQTTYFYKKNEVTTMPMNSHCLLGVHLIIHVTASDEILERLYDKFTHLDEFPSLGRKEDLVRIDEVSLVGIEEIKVDDQLEEEEEGVINMHKLKYPIYIPIEAIQDREVYGIHYRLNSYYASGTKPRKWQQTDVLYVEKDFRLGNGTIYLDSSKDRDIAYFNLEV